jgi:hypothetical protein
VPKMAKVLELSKVPANKKINEGSFLKIKNMVPGPKNNCT